MGPPRLTVVDNTAGTLGAVAGQLSLSAGGAVTNAGGRLEAATDLTLSGQGLGNAGGPRTLRMPPAIATPFGFDRVGESAVAARRNGRGRTARRSTTTRKSRSA